MNEENNKQQNATVKVEPCDNYVKIQFLGKRTIKELLNNWLEIADSSQTSSNKMLIEDSMHGKLSTYDIWNLFEEIKENRFYKNASVAIVLEDQTSYNQKLFDTITKNDELKIKHFPKEQEAIDWLNK